MSLSRPDEAELLAAGAEAAGLGLAEASLAGCFLDGRGPNFLNKLPVLGIRPARRVDSKGLVRKRSKGELSAGGATRCDLLP